MLDLAAVHDVLGEHAVFVADAVAERGQVQRGHRIEEAGGQPAEAAVAQGGVELLLLDVLEAACMGLHAGRRLLAQTERVERIAQAAPDEELHRQVVHAACPGAALGGLRLDPALGELLARRLGDGAHEVGRIGLVGGYADGGQQFMVQVDEGVVVHGVPVKKKGPSPQCLNLRGSRTDARRWLATGFAAGESRSIRHSL